MIRVLKTAEGNAVEFIYFKPGTPAHGLIDGGITVGIRRGFEEYSKTFDLTPAEAIEFAAELVRAVHGDPHQED